MLPWITIPNLGLHILPLHRRQLPEDWTKSDNVWRWPLRKDWKRILNR